MRHLPRTIVLEARFLLRATLCPSWLIFFRNPNEPLRTRRYTKETPYPKSLTLCPAPETDSSAQFLSWRDCACTVDARGTGSRRLIPSSLIRSRKLTKYSKQLI